MNDDDLTIPDFLRLTTEQRQRAREKSKDLEVKIVTFQYDPLKPISISDDEWEQINKERRKKKPIEAPKKKTMAKLDTTGMRWDARKGKWVKDKFAHLCIAPSTIVKPPCSLKNKASFGIPEGTNRDRLAKAMVNRLGEMVTLKEWSKLVYGKENEGPCFNVMVGFIRDLKMRGLRFEIIRDKDKKGQVTFGLFELE